MVMPDQPKVRARRRYGFTIIELLVVVFVLGVLAAVAITRFGESKRRAHLAVLKSELRNLGLIAETKFSAENSYAGVVPPRGSAGITLTFEGTATSWSATARHEALPNFVCEARSGAQMNCY
jgi:prepilin-type N-terminal cleavage/methylation domain-containing protein